MKCLAKIWGGFKSQKLITYIQKNTLNFLQMLFALQFILFPILPNQISLEIKKKEKKRGLF